MSDSILMYHPKTKQTQYIRADQKKHDDMKNAIAGGWAVYTPAADKTKFDESESKEIGEILKQQIKGLTAKIEKETPKPKKRKSKKTK